MLDNFNNLSIVNSSNVNAANVDTTNVDAANVEDKEQICNGDTSKNHKKKKKIKKKIKSKENVTQPIAKRPMHEVYVELLNQWLQDNKIGKNQIKRISIAREMFWKCCDVGITEEDLISIRKKLSESEFVFQTGNLWDQLNTFFGSTKITNFMKQIAELTPTGLNTSPNACCGKFERIFYLRYSNGKSI